MGNDTQKLSHVVLDIGFFCALGTKERCHKTSDEVNERCVQRKTPNTWSSNNGVMVVYDEVGRPWIMDHSQVTEEVQEKLRSFSLTQGAYVPHSNDGGNFVRNVVLKF
jgi:hypothetical protein